MVNFHAALISSKSQYLQILAIFQRFLKGTCVNLLEFYLYYRIYMDIHNSFVHEVLIDLNVETGIHLCIFCLYIVFVIISITVNCPVCPLQLSNKYKLI